MSTTNVMTLDKLKQSSMLEAKKKAEQTAKDISRLAFPMNYCKDESIISQLDNDEKESLQNSLKTIADLSSLTKQALLDRSIIENHLMASVITKQAEQDDVKSEEIKLLREHLEQNALSYSDVDKDIVSRLEKQQSDKKLQTLSQRRARAQQKGLQLLYKH